MTGFFLQIKNGLLKDNHQERMDSSVWLFMWYIDKITSITEDGKGIVLGGKPITYEKVHKSLKISDKTYRRWVNNLKRYGYINVKRSPNGLIVSVNKSFKRFGLKVLDKNDRSDRSKMTDPVDKNDRSYIYDNTVNNTNTVNSNGIKKLKDLNISDEERDYIAEGIILKALKDKESKAFYKLVASKIPLQIIEESLSEIKVDGARKPAAVFTDRMKKYAEARI